MKESTKQAIAKAVAEAVGGAVSNAARAGALAAPASPATPAAPTEAQLRSMSNNEFMDAFGAARIVEAAAVEPDPQTVREALPVILQEAVTQGRLTQDQANAALLDRGIITVDNAHTAEELRQMSDSEFLDAVGSAMVSTLPPRPPSPWSRLGGS